MPGQTDKEKRRLLHFVVVGGGPTGVEFAAELSDMIKEDLNRFFPSCRDSVKITLVEAMDHILSMYDKEISDYTVEHFKRSSINVEHNTFVKEVKADQVLVQKKGSKDIESWPCAVVVWATGIRPRPIIKQLREAIGEEIQANKNALVTDQHLQVLGAKGVFALGDCATIDQPKLIAKLVCVSCGALLNSCQVDLFNEADTDNDGHLTESEFQVFVQNNSSRFPQLELYAKNATKVFASADENSDQHLSLEEFTKVLQDADKKLRRLPATAQVANQASACLYLKPDL